MTNPPVNVSVSFSCEHEQHNRKEFQQGGHFVPGLTDANGFRRPWSGEDVHVLTLWREIKDGDSITSRQQILRVLSDSVEEASRVMAENIRDTFFALNAGAQLRSTLQDDWNQRNEQSKRFIEWCKERGIEIIGDTLEEIARNAILTHVYREALEK